MLIVIFPLFVTVEFLNPPELIYSAEALSSFETSSIDIPTKPSVAPVGCVKLFNTISPSLVISEPFLPIIAAVFTAVKDIPLSKVGSKGDVPEFVTFDL